MDIIDSISGGHIRKCPECGQEFEAMENIVADGLVYNHRARKHGITQ